VHKRRTGFARRINRVASSLESRGVRATYSAHDRLLTNRGARKSFGQHPPALDDVQQRIVDELRVEGFCVVPYAELAGEERWNTLAADADRFVAETEEGLAREAAGEDGGLRRSTKDYLVRRNAWGAKLPPDDLWLQAALDPRLLDIANSYLGMWSKVEYVDLWHTPPTEASSRTSSQRWHRDFNDRLLLKAFVYLNDVDVDSGPFEYVPRSFPGSELGDLWPWWPGYDGYPPDDEFERRMKDVPVKTFTGTRGTLILCNTSGFHRGGYATGKPRTLATWTYCSPAALKALSERNYTVSGDLSALAADAQHAVS
jgi:hypothetical protein